MGLAPRIDKLDVNYFINGDMAISQRFVNNAAVISNGYNVDRWKQIYINQVGLVLGTNGRTDRSTTELPGMSTASLAVNMNNASPDTDFIRIAQRIESIHTRRIKSTKIVMQAKIKRGNTAKLDTKLRFALRVPTTADVHTDLVAPANFDQVLVPTKLNNAATLDLTLADVSNTQFDTYYAIFDVPANKTKGLEMSVQLVRNAGDKFDNFAFIYLGELMLTEGEAVPDFLPAGKGIPGKELRMCQRYYEKSYALDEPVGFNPQLAGAHWWNGIGVSNRPFTEIYFKVSKRAIPSLGLWNPQNGISNSIRDSDTPVDFTSNAGRQGLAGFTVNPNGTPTGTAVLGIHWAADAEL